MANKRDTSKQKRARENRAQRDALKARTAAASTAPEERRSRATSTDEAARDTKASRAAARSARTRPVRPGDVPVDVETLEGSFFAKRNQVPGGRQVMFAFAMTVIVSVLLAFQKYATPEEIERDPDIKGTHSIFEAFGTARATAFLLLPIVIVGVALAFSLHPKRRRIWLGATILLAIFTLLTGMTLDLIVIGFLVFGLQRASKVEGPMPGSLLSGRGRRGEAEAPAADADAEV